MPLPGFAGRAAIVVIAAAACALLAYVVVCDFVVGALADDRIGIAADAKPAAFLFAPLTGERDGINPATLSAATQYLSGSPRLHSRSAEFYRYRPGDDSIITAERHAARAAALSPHDYRPWLLLSQLQESRDRLDEAENSIRHALKLAPASIDARWQLGVLLLRSAKSSQALSEFRMASAGPPQYARAALELVWSELGEEPGYLVEITPDDAAHRLELAQFLVEVGRPDESAAVFRRLSRAESMRNPATPRYLNKLIAAGNLAIAHDLWRDLRDASRHERSQAGSQAIVWNGGFESDILLDYAQFDWSIRQSNYARISIDTANAHGGSRSLRLDFAGRDTTRLSDEVKQLAFVQPRRKYLLRYFVKCANLVSPEGPRVVLYEGSSGKYITSSDPVRKGSGEWQAAAITFSSQDPALTVAVEQWAAYSYEEPTRGTVWFDDFEIVESPHAFR